MRLVLGDDRGRDQGGHLTHVVPEARLKVREARPVDERHGADVETGLDLAIIAVGGTKKAMRKTLETLDGLVTRG